MKRFLVGIALLASACASTNPGSIQTPTTPVVQAKTCAIMVPVFYGDPANDRKIAGARIDYSGATSWSFLTDEAGNGTITLPEGSYTITVSAGGYLSTTATLPVCSTNSVPVSLDAEVVAPPPTVYREFNGRVKLNGRTYSDELGMRPRLGATLFWLPWGVKNDPVRTEANVKYLAEHGVDFVRAFAEVCGGSWTDREIRPDWPNYKEILQQSTKLVNSYGMRVEWTLFAGGCYTSRNQWMSAANLMVEALKPVANGVQLVEITNEQQLPDQSVVRDIAALVRSEVGFEVALSGTPEKELPILYAGSAATIGTLHTDRADGDFGFRPMRQIWGYWELEDMPKACQNNEPIGIGSSVRVEEDPTKIATEAVTTWIAGCAAYVAHSGAGIYGRAYTHPTAGFRPANLWEQPKYTEALDLITRIKNMLPDDLPNWTRANNHWNSPNPVPPFRFDQSILGDGMKKDYGVVRSFTAQRDGEFWTIIINPRGNLGTTSTRGFSAQYYPLNTLDPKDWTGSIKGDGVSILVHGR